MKIPALRLAFTAFFMTLVVWGCSDKNGADPLAQDTTLSRDLALANRDTASQPALTDVPVSAEPAPVTSTTEPQPVAEDPPAVRQRVARPAPSAPPSSRRAAETRPSRRATAPAPETPVVTESGNLMTPGTAGSERPVGVVSAGAEMSLTSGQRICTNTNSVGDSFTATLANPVMGANGAIIPAGASARVRISSLEKSRKAGEEIQIGLRVESITFGGKTYAVSSEVTYAQVDKVRAESRGSDAGKVATGAVIGAVVGRVLGGKTRSAVIGAATGAAAGAVIANRNADFDGCVPDGGRITVRLTEPLTIQVTD